MVASLENVAYQTSLLIEFLAYQNYKIILKSIRIKYESKRIIF